MQILRLSQRCDISSQGLLDGDAMKCCGRIPMFHPEDEGRTDL
jgi:hypothetical protein